MYQNKNINFNITSSSSFVGYLDYTTTSLGNYNNIYNILSKNIIKSNIPTFRTKDAIIEARNHNNLKGFNNIDDVFDDLEK